MRGHRWQEELLPLALVAAGAVPGALLRWQLGLQTVSTVRPLHGWIDDNLIANLLGSFLLGVLVAQPPQRARLLLWGGIGLCGSLTTFSTWMLQVCQTLLAGRLAQAAALLLLPLPLALALLGLGYRLGQRLAATTLGRQQVGRQHLEREQLDRES